MTVVLQTERLVLRWFREDDAAALLQLDSDPEVLRYVQRKPLADVAAYLRHIQTAFLPWYERADGYGSWAIIEKATSEFIGGCSLKPALDVSDAVAMGYTAEEVALGYGLRRASWGNGYATEFARALVNRAFTDLGAACVVASVLAANAASIRVLEKAGLRRLPGLFQPPDEDMPSLKYALTREQFTSAVPPTTGSSSPTTD